MAKHEEREIQTWGTWEELLLACAVKRYGTKNWDSIAMEIQNRSSCPHLLTSENCKRKYYDLERRFTEKDVKIDEDEEDESETDHVRDKMIPWLDELRKLRVAELRREVERYDDSIVSLQLKVKRLREEREQSLEEEENNEEKPDLTKEKTAGSEKPEKSSPDNVVGKPASIKDSDHENQSFNESNSTDLKGNNRNKEEHEPDDKPKPVEPATVIPDPVHEDLASDKPVGEGSYNGSSDTIAKDTKVPAVKKTSVAVLSREACDAPDRCESAARQEEGTKESSDVQSSASLSRNKRRKSSVSGSSSGEEREPEIGEVFPANDRVSKKPEPLFCFLEIITSHKYGSVFERRLQSQETDEYRSIIRQHVDLKTVKTRLEQGRYSGCRGKFFRDLLLLFNNAIVFFPKDSAESVAAIELRQLVLKKINSGNRKSYPPPPSPEEPTIPRTVRPTSKRDPESSDSLLLKPNKSSVPSIACRKRSSIERKADQKAGANEEKPVQDRKKSDVSSSANVFEDQNVEKKRTRERSTSAAGISKNSGVNRKNTKNNTSKNSHRISVVKRESTPEENRKVKTEKKINMEKKQSAANFLSRIKRNSSSSVNNSNSRNGGGDAVAAATKDKKNSGRGDGGRDQIFRKNASVKQTLEQSSPSKRSVGRPPKRGTTSPLPPPPLEVVASRRPRKRTRR